jgi:hypothetical protein
MRWSQAVPPADNVVLLCRRPSLLAMPMTLPATLGVRPSRPMQPGKAGGTSTNTSRRVS